ncbi:eCIS core domain-containing protein [Streptomyces buecherae]|uniref:eCIS core domain-containing protein n=1 Tax=Streptomyces buecherae TaxID=2763006 RepID=UPI0037A61E4A
MGVRSPLALQRSVGNATVVQMLRRAETITEEHRHGAGCGHETPAEGVVQRSAIPGVLRTGGRPLDEATRTDMEARMGADFSDVRIHSDSAARASAAEIGARAYTSGNHIVIGNSGTDQHTLAHELTHVIQQRRGPVSGTDNGAGLKVSDPSDRFEREAEANATRVMRAPAAHTAHLAGEPAPVTAGASRAPEVVQRAVYTDSQGNNYTTADFFPGGEQRERPERVEVIVSAPIGRSATPPPMSFLSPVNGLDPDIGWQRGHVAALEVGGENASYNIVPMKPGFNHGGPWRAIERAVRQAADAHTRGTVRLRVELEYSGPDPRVPSRISCTLEESESTGTWQPLVVPQVLPQGRAVLVHKAERTPLPTPAQEELLTTTPPTPIGVGQLGDLVTDQSEAQNALNLHTMPSASKAQWPDALHQPFPGAPPHGHHRPYQHLDLQMLGAMRGDQNGMPVNPILPHAVFTEDQRRLILQANLARNNGQLRSDDPNDPHEVLDEDGTANYPEIDHIIPRSAGGSNAYSNARVVSWELNNKLDRVKSINQLVDPRRLAPPMTTELDVQIWYVVLRGAVTESDIVRDLGMVYNIEPTQRAIRKVDEALPDLVARGCLVVLAQGYGIGPTDPKRG